MSLLYLNQIFVTHMCQSVHNHSNANSKRPDKFTVMDKHIKCSKCLPLALTHALRRSRHWLLDPLLAWYAPLDSRLRCNQTLLQLINAPRWLLLNIFLHHSLYLVVHRIRVRTVGRQQVLFDKIRSFVSQQLNGLAHAHGVLARCPAVHNALAECWSFAEQAVNSNVALLGHSRCVTRSFCRLTGDATVQFFISKEDEINSAYVRYFVQQLSVIIISIYYAQSSTLIMKILTQVVFHKVV